MDDFLQERIKFLDKKIHPGLTKLTWASKGPTTDYFMNECRGHASKVQAIVDSYKHANRSIQALCKRISESLLVSIDSKRIYESNEVGRCGLVCGSVCGLVSGSVCGFVCDIVSGSVCYFVCGFVRAVVCGLVCGFLGDLILP